MPASLDVREGTLVYLDRDDGLGQVIGRVAAVEVVDQDRARLNIRMMASSADMARGGVLKGAPATLNLRDAMRLLISPNTPDQEAMLARDAIWPSILANVVPGMIDRLVTEVTDQPVQLDVQDKALLAKSVEQLRRELQPLEEQLINRLATRTWEALGVRGLAAGIWRSTTNSAREKGQPLSDFWQRAFRGEATATPATRPFLSEEASAAVRSALEEEILAFWQENKEALVAALGRVVTQRRPEFEAALRERWSKVLYERAVAPAWLAGQDKVLEAVQTYANDFAARRLLTNEGGPRLLFAYVLRASLRISDAPLLVFAPASGENDGSIVYQPYLP